MSFSIEFADESPQYQARIKVIGVGGSGNNAINTMIHFGLEGVEFISVNTDAQALNANLAPLKLSVGQTVTRGLGAGADPERGRKAALEDVTALKDAIAGADMVFVTAGMGGGTGTGAAPVIAQLAREAGALTVAVVTKPFVFEGRQRARRAEQGLAALNEHVDTLITIPNEKLVALGDDDMSFVDAFRKADEVLYQAVKGISDLITQEGIVNVDFADVRTVMENMGRALMGTGCAKGEGRARLAAEAAIQSPLLDNISVDGATGVLINVVGGPDMKMREINEAATYIQEQAHEDANIIFGATIDENMAEAIKVTVIATGFQRAAEEPQELLRQASRQPLERQAPRGSVQDLRSEHPAPRRDSRPELHRQELQRSEPHRSEPQRSEYPRPELSSRALEELDREPATAYSTRRPAAAAASLQANAPNSGLPSVRDRITFPSNVDRDWDTPAYQRRNGG